MGRGRRGTLPFEDASFDVVLSVFGSHMPPPPEGFQPPILWGNEDHVRQLFEGTALELTFDHASVQFAFESAEAFMAEYEAKFGPVVIARATLEPQGKWDALRQDMLTLDESFNTSDQGDLQFPGEYLVVTGGKSS